MRKEQYDKYRKLGKCVLCGKKVDDGNFARCSICRNKYVEVRQAKIKAKLCTRCGLPIPNERKSKTCFDCYQKIGVRAKKFGKENKIKLINFAGGSCSVCGLKTDIIDVYDFHHKNANEKEQSIASLLRYEVDIERVKKEVAKCILVCANCHRTIHYNLRNGKI